jgi:hypothetical protein
MSDAEFEMRCSTKNVPRRPANRAPLIGTTRRTTTRRSRSSASAGTKRVPTVRGCRRRAGCSGGCRAKPSGKPPRAGSCDRRHAWGDDFDPARGNTFETHISVARRRWALSLAATPRKASPTSAATSGNGRAAPTEPYPYVPDPPARRSGRNGRVPTARRCAAAPGTDLRGGARCACRFRREPGWPVTAILGLRLVCVSPILNRCPLDL